MAYGYRSYEVPILQGKLEVDDKAKISNIKQTDVTIRQPEMVSLGPSVRGAAPPHPDSRDAKTMVDGIKKRFACKMPAPMSSLRRRKFRRFVKKWCNTNLTPLAADADCSVEAWLDKTEYPLHRKEILLRKNRKILDPHEERYKLVKSFVKDETYPTFKHARAINSRTDEFKTLVGPIFKLIEKEVFAHSCFIKKIPVSQRPQYILDLLESEGCSYMATDFTSFEAHFVELMEDCEFIMYDYMVQHLPDGKQFMKLITEALLSENLCVFRACNVRVWRRRMSGEMCTSLGNGFTNLMLILYMFKLAGQPEPKCVVEGDDGLTRVEGNVPGEDIITELGLKLKLEIHENISEASFCGLIFDRDSKQIVTNPKYTMCHFGWTSAKYLKSSRMKKKELLRAKALSLCYQYPGCPILNRLGRKYVELTDGLKHDLGNAGTYWTERFNIEKNFWGDTIPFEEPTDQTRKLAERIYSIDISKQLKIERYIDSITTIQELNCNEILDCMEPDWVLYSACYVVDLNDKAYDTLMPHTIPTGDAVSSYVAGR